MTLISRRALAILIPLTVLCIYYLSIPGDPCQSFDPDSPERDHPDCLRARQYRQVERVLAREIKAEQDHNIDTLYHLLRCFAEDPSPCPPKPLVLSGWWYTAEVVSGATTGEVIWQRGLARQLEALGMSFIAVGPYENWITVAEMMPDVYRLIWNSDIDTVSCITDPRCVAQYTPPVDGVDLSIGVPEDERGVIPIWALNVVDYWGCQPKAVGHSDHWWGVAEDGEWSYQPLGQEWIATPWPLPGGHVYLPYSIEKECLELPVKSPEQRNDSVLIFAKRSSYFDAPYATPREYWTRLNNEPDMHLLVTATEEEGHPLPDGLITMGKQSLEAYSMLVGSVKVLLGMGAPHISPSVYTALCQGTPVVIPHHVENPRTDGWHLYTMAMQHGPAQMIGEPYVYAYYTRNYTELHNVIRKAMVTPIDRYIPPDMKFDYAAGRLKAYLDRDLEEMYREAVAKHGSLPKLRRGARERCRELGRCAADLPVGRIPSLSGI